MKICVLTSSRADYSIYLPLLKAIQNDFFFSLHIIAFGTHVSVKHGYTIDKIREDGFSVTAIETVSDNDGPRDIAMSISKTVAQFSLLWQESDFDLVLCLGDRYEMYAACTSAVPFNIKLAHIHGGEKTTGAIDDAFRHSMTHMSQYHFTASKEYYDRVVRLKESDENVYNVGSLSIDNLKELKLFSIVEFKEHFGIDLSIPTILITFHPETISYEKNETFIQEIIAALEDVTTYQFVITMPNADTMGSLIRDYFNKFIKRNPNAIGVESLGTIGYLSCMKHASFMLGNTSSGFIEASFFPKYVINLGDRQNGRIITSNVNSIPINKQSILTAIQAFNGFNTPKVIDIYGEGKTASKILHILKEKFKDAETL